MESTETFSLLSEPWIPVSDADGGISEVSLRSVLADADRVVSIKGESSTQTFALIRLLLAIVHRAIDGPKDSDAWVDLYETGRLPQKEIAAYLDRHAERFELFHPVTPFYQVPDLRSGKNEVSTLEKLLADVPAGGRLFTARSGEALARITLPEAARWLVQVQAYDVSGIKTGAVGDPRVKGGKGYPIGTGHAGALGGIYVHGKNLTDTLLLNMVSDRKIGTPVWEREPHTAAPEGHAEVLREPTGITDLYTWQSRRVRLIRDGDDVTGVVLTNGDKILAHETYPLEPMTMWRRSPIQEKKLKTRPVYFPRTLDPRKALWRSAESLLPLSHSGGTTGEPPAFQAPGVIKHLRARMEDDLDESVRLTARAVGVQYGTQNAVVDEVMEDELSFSVAVLADNAKISALISGAVECATQACKAVGLFAADLVRAAGGDDAVQVARRDTARENAYEAIDRHFRSWISGLDASTDLLSSRTAWQRAAQGELVLLADDLVKTAPPAAYIGRVDGDIRTNLATARRRFDSRLRKALPAAYESIDAERATA